MEGMIFECCSSPYLCMQQLHPATAAAAQSIFSSSFFLLFSHGQFQPGEGGGGESGKRARGVQAWREREGRSTPQISPKAKRGRQMERRRRGEDFSFNAASSCGRLNPLPGRFSLLNILKRNFLPSESGINEQLLLLMPPRSSSLKTETAS